MLRTIIKEQYIYRRAPKSRPNRLPDVLRYLRDARITGSDVAAVDRRLRHIERDLDPVRIQDRRQHPRPKMTPRGTTLPASE
jgi:hypothetical protein